MKLLGDEVRKVTERYWKDEEIAATGKLVLLVEGDDDRDFVEALLTQKRRNWRIGVRVVVAGGRPQVLEQMKNRFPNAMGLVDRDTWTDEELEALRRSERRLYVTEGWCLENLFLEPGFLKHFDERVAAQISIERERWVRAGALWWTLQRMREAQQRWQVALKWDYGLPRDDLDLRSGKGVAESLSQKIPEATRREARIDVETVGETFEARLAEVSRWSEAEQWRRGVHGKKAFTHLLVQSLQKVRGQDSWRAVMAREIGRPAPLDELLAMLLP